MSTRPDTFQIPAEVAERYEAEFVPSLFAPLAVRLVAFAGITAGDRVLDVGCGTGIVARTAADRGGAATGLDLNEAMLAVARRLRPDLDWHRGDAAALPFPDGSFDVTLCQSVLMFVPEPAAALREMARVTAPGGTVAVQVWGSPQSQRGFRPLAEAVARHAGADAVDLVSTYFRLGDLDALVRQCDDAGLAVTGVETSEVTLHAPSVDAYVTTEIGSTPLAERLDAAAHDRIRADARAGLAPFCDTSGALALPFEIHLVRARPA
ncbi:methyltransferase domain-containing protein [Pseudonocardia sp.]|uniref:methyltransferase domain-containing protein n=1 Tax=Pseudonocardia sp. TaxID=60912 RepID=UPI003D0EA94E